MMSRHIIPRLVEDLSVQEKSWKTVALQTVSQEETTV